MESHKSGLFLVKSRPKQISQKQIYRTGELIPSSGIYRVVHREHRLPHEVTLLKDEQFPRCCKCNNSVTFELVYAARTEKDQFRDVSIRICVYELPEMEPSSNNQQIAG